MRFLDNATIVYSALLCAALAVWFFTSLKGLLVLLFFVGLYGAVYLLAGRPGSGGENNA